MRAPHEHRSWVSATRGRVAPVIATGAVEGVATPTLETRLRDYDTVASAITWLASQGAGRRVVAQSRLGDVAVALSVSASQLERTFGRFAEVSPGRLLRWLSADAPRRLLRERPAAFDAACLNDGRAPDRRNASLVALQDVAADSYADRDVVLRTGTHATTLGLVFVAVGDAGVAAFRFIDGDPDAVREGFASEWRHATIVEDPTAGEEVVSRFARHLQGAVVDPIPVLACGTRLQRRVWEALQAIPEATVTTYARVASLAGNPRAVRAAATAVGRNPVAGLVPCHRVLPAAGGIGGYRWGQVRKRALLAREAARADA